MEESSKQNTEEFFFCQICSFVPASLTSEFYCLPVFQLYPYLLSLSQFRPNPVSHLTLIVSPVVSHLKFQPFSNPFFNPNSKSLRTLSLTLAIDCKHLKKDHAQMTNFIAYIFVFHFIFCKTICFHPLERCVLTRFSRNLIFTNKSHVVSR